MAGLSNGVKGGSLGLFLIEGFGAILKGRSLDRPFVVAAFG
jgi:hypothetical protein